MERKEIKYDHSPIIEFENGIILAKFQAHEQLESGYQSEKELEEKLIKDLVSQGYERLHAKNIDDLMINLRTKIERLNKVKFNNNEWERYVTEYIDKSGDGILEKTEKVQEDNQYEFKFDDGTIKNIIIIDKKNLINNSLQVVNQIEAEDQVKNRYDVTILVNGLPLVHIELKRRGAKIEEAFNQIHRYNKETFRSEHSLYKFVQIFVISNGSQTRYFSNTTNKSKMNFEFTSVWADSRNNLIYDLEDFTSTFFQKRVILEILTKYCVYSKDTQTLLVMRPYQIAATERILWKIKSSHDSKQKDLKHKGGYIWHTTGSGKTLTSFKTAKLATELDFIDKVFFVVDRKDLDYQTMREFKKFDEDSVSGSKSSNDLKRVIETTSNKIIVTTIQKFNKFIKENKGHPVYKQQCVIIFDECHRSQFGEAQKNIRSSFKNYYQFGFTGTPIVAEVAYGEETTASVFGQALHKYVITDAIRDNKVLKFKVDYLNVVPKYKNEESDEESLGPNIERNPEALLHKERISEITKKILDIFDEKTHRNVFQNIEEKRKSGFNAMFAVESIDAAKLYYAEFKKQISKLPENKQIRVATIFSFNPNEEQKYEGEILEEEFEIPANETDARTFLSEVVLKDYNKYFKSDFSIEKGGFEDYYKDLSKQVKDKKIDLLIVVGMFLTGFDAPWLNTLFVDKNLKYHGLIQAFSRTNRILGKSKAFGNIVCFRDLIANTQRAIEIFGDENSANIILEKSYNDYISGFEDPITQKRYKGFVEISEELNEKFSNLSEIKLEKDKLEFVKLFGQFLVLQNKLRNYFEFKSFDQILTPRQIQDMKAFYLDFKNQFKNEERSRQQEEQGFAFDEVVFYIDLLRTDEINLDYILGLIYDENRVKNLSIDEIKRMIRSSIGLRAKEELIIDFIEKEIDLKNIKSKEEVITKFYEYAQNIGEKAIQSMINEMKLDPTKSQEVIKAWIVNGNVETLGIDFNEILPKVSRIGGKRKMIKDKVIEKANQLVEIFNGIFYK